MLQTCRQDIPPHPPAALTKFPLRHCTNCLFKGNPTLSLTQRQEGRGKLQLRKRRVERLSERGGDRR